MRVMAVGTPGDIGGAPVEMWATVRLWRKHGVEVSVQPTSPVSAGWSERLAEIGVPLGPVPKTHDELAGLIRGPVAVGFCSAPLALASPHVKGVKIVWTGCMTAPFPFEEQVYRNRVRAFDAYTFQSQCQMDALADFHSAFGVPKNRRYLIRGAFDVAEYAALGRGRRPDEPLVIGRISRPHPRKFTKDIWQRFATIRELAPCKFRVLGWQPHISSRHTGDPPDWVECLEPGAERVQDFLASCHVLCQFGEAEENWPRVGLEAMAAGVPLVVEKRGGWLEMVEHNVSGYCCANAAEMGAAIARLSDESHRLFVANAARRRVRELADEDAIWAGWERVFRDTAR